MEDRTAEPPGFVDYLAPFETFQAYSIRGGTIYWGRIRSTYASDRGELRRVLRAAPGEYCLEELGGRLYATLRTYRGRRPPLRLWLHVLLLLFTIVTTVGAGVEFTRQFEGKRHRLVAVTPFDFAAESVGLAAAGRWSELAGVWPDFAAEMQKGLLYASALLFVLLAHEMGHYLMARRYGVDATLPFLLPAPVLFGTFGAIIRMRSPVTHRRALFDVGVAGPIAGIVAGLIVAVIGLKMSAYGQPPMRTAGPDPAFALQSSALFRFLAGLALGPKPPGHVLRFHPVAVAGWFGLFVTFLNLLPLGQLDGGHMWYALIGRGQRYVGWAAFVLLLGMGWVFFGWVVLAVLVALFLRVRHPPLMDESVRLGPLRTLIGIGVIVLFLLLFIPEPVVPVM
jgi:membrane-associated protease RseP (regulator of RpoE activity)